MYVEVTILFGSRWFLLNFHSVLRQADSWCGCVLRERKVELLDTSPKLAMWLPIYIVGACPEVLLQGRGTIFSTFGRECFRKRG